MKKLKVGIIGVGMAFERLHYPAYQQLTDRYEIVALCDLETQKTHNWAKRLNLNNESIYTDFQKMLSRNDLDVIDIIVWRFKNNSRYSTVNQRRKNYICG